ncbi:hypothetical protein BpHYR1_045032 [Brachionus plicatilis]|uniref:Uncharacterized protein n=1 Tax=Brachionus plicatilis TaxID=10195 RepID=A0A3M7QQY2_BRAPC|nr:hypothetical protein BpHYR1_045032 [Brachionus plicatilis]
MLQTFENILLNLVKSIISDQKYKNLFCNSINYRRANDVKNPENAPLISEFRESLKIMIK